MTTEQPSLVIPIVAAALRMIGVAVALGYAYPHLVSAIAHVRAN
jgi:hypothetical protein